MKLNKKRMTGTIALKLDMPKANNKIVWTYLQVVLTSLGFNMQWIQIIMTCVPTINYLVLVNGCQGELIKPSRGLRQGDHLSSYLILICAGGLSSLLDQVEYKGDVMRLAIIRNDQNQSPFLSITLCFLVELQKMNGTRCKTSSISIGKGLGQVLNKLKSSI